MFDRIDWHKAERWEAMDIILREYNILKFNWGAEIGVREGQFSEYLFAHNPALHMYCVDPYTPYQDVASFYNREKQDAWAEEAFKRMDNFLGRVHWKLETSAKASLDVDDESLDFVFIDAEHTEPACYTDCVLWEPKVRKGGFITGHDYLMEPVKKAVDRFAAEWGKKVFHIPFPADIWVIVK